MKIHIFNPDHDLALAANIDNFTSPHAGRQLRSDLGYLPALWAEAGDYVLVDDLESAVNGMRKLKVRYSDGVSFVTSDRLEYILSGRKDVEVMPWGWNRTLRATLLRYGVPEGVMPAVDTLAQIRELSGRHVAVELLKELRDIDGTVGLSAVCHDYDEVMEFMQRYEEVVVKAPWSSSGRGVRYINKESLTDNVQKWIVNILQRQGSVVAEQRCCKVMDFAMEYIAHADGSVRACGLSLFTTANTAYTGNMLETEKEKAKLLSQYVVPALLDKVVSRTETFLASRINGAYTGPLGVDMMVCAKENGNGFLLNPCIEINLRRTMGHVALALSEAGARGNMQVAYEGKSYKLKINK